MRISQILSTTRCSWLGLLLFGLLVVGSATADDAPTVTNPARYVIHISVDGLRSDAITRNAPEKLPNFYRLRREGAFTDNARTDYDRSNTLPNHTSQLTGRGVMGAVGHNWTKNDDPRPDETLHSNKGEYVASVFDVVHDHGLSTALYSTKTKFSIFDQSYDERSGARDVTGADNGRDKIDRFVVDEDSRSLVNTFVEDMKKDPYEYAFVHLKDPDSAGHWHDWDMHSGSAYLRSIQDVDMLLGQILDLISNTPQLAGQTVVVLTSDHGGGGNWHNHGDASDARNYTIPFYVWGAGVDVHELYTMNQASRTHPGMGRPSYRSTLQPIRNGDAANASLSALGLPAVPGSTINVAHDLAFLRPLPVVGPVLADDTSDAPAGTEAARASTESVRRAID